MMPPGAEKKPVKREMGAVTYVNKLGGLMVAMHAKDWKRVLRLAIEKDGSIHITMHSIPIHLAKLERIKERK